jgi:hypothetical protein
MSRFSPSATVSGVFVGSSLTEAMAATTRFLRGEARFIDLDVGSSSIRFTDNPRSPFVSKSRYSLRFEPHQDGTRLTVTVQATGLAVGDFFGFYRRMAEELLQSLSIVPVDTPEEDPVVDDGSRSRPLQLVVEYVFISVLFAAVAYLLSSPTSGVVVGLALVVPVPLAIVFWQSRARRQRSAMRSDSST